MFRMDGEYCLNCNSNCLNDIQKNNEKSAVQLFSVTQLILEKTFGIKDYTVSEHAPETFLCKPCGTTFFEFCSAKTKFSQRRNSGSKIAHVTEPDSPSENSKISSYLKPAPTKHKTGQRQNPFRNSFQCPYSYCAKTFSNCTSRVFVSHIKRHEIFIVNKKTKVGKRLLEFYNEQDKNYSCPKCTNTFTTLSMYLDHFGYAEDDHASEYRIVFLEEEKSKIKFAFKCQKCPNSFPSKYLLRQHYVTHIKREKKWNEAVTGNNNRESKTPPTKKSSCQGWSCEQDEELKSLVVSFGEDNWNEIAKNFPHRSEKQCAAHYIQIKNRWTKEEDDKIIELLEKYRSGKWSIIAKHLKGRTQNQCRERWLNHLKPDINKDPWTEEDKLIYEAQGKYGNQWAKISTLLPGRTLNSIRNRWNCSIKRKMVNLSIIPVLGRKK